MFIYILILLLSLSCTFDYQQVDEVEEVEHPDFILQKTTYHINRSSTDPLIFTADRAEFFSRKDSVILLGVTFEQVNEKGEIIIGGTADSASIDTNTNDTILEGNIDLRSQTEALTIETESLYWNHEQQSLKSPDDLLVTVHYDDGSIVEGYGFNADFSKRIIEFAQMTEGVIQYE